jgi:hypothetical protein
MSEKPASLPPPLKPDSWRCPLCLVTFRVQEPGRQVERSACSECGKPFWSGVNRSGGGVPLRIGMWPHPYSEFLEEIQ